MLPNSTTNQEIATMGSNTRNGARPASGNFNQIQPVSNIGHHNTRPIQFQLPLSSVPSSTSPQIPTSSTIISSTTHQNTQQLRPIRSLLDLSPQDILVAIRDKAIGSWMPHPLSPQERSAHNRDTTQCLAEIRILEQKRTNLFPRANPELNVKLWAARVDYQLRFWRTFRMNDLPTEIVTNIFRFVVWASPVPQAGVRWRLWLTWTCKHWRTIALEDPTIWSAIWFRDLPPFERSLAWFDRAGDAPLDLRINDGADRKFTDKEMGNLMDTLCTKILSIRMFIIILEDWEPVLTILDKLRTAAVTHGPPSIERFELHRSGSPYVQIGDGYQPSSLRHPLPLFGGVPTPKLTYFSINGVYIDWRQSHLRNLTTLDLRRMPLERSPELSQFRDILTSSPALRKLCLDGAGPQWHPEDYCDLPPVQLSQLKIFILADVSLHYALYILRHIATPNVLDLTLMNLVGEDYTPLFGVMTARFPAVKLLTLYSVETLHSPGAGRVLVKWLDSMPLLSYLRLANIKRLFLDAFLYSPESFLPVSDDTSSTKNVVCPSVTVIDFKAMDPKLIADWGLARKRIGVPLRKFYVTKESFSKMSDEEKETLNTTAELNVMEYGATAVEEELILQS